MGKGSKSKKIVEESESEVYHVEVITKARVVVDSADESSDQEGDRSSSRRKKRKRKKEKEKGKKSEARWEYYVKWAGYDSEANSWEPQENLETCVRLLGSFWEHVGMDNQDYPVGYEAVAKDHWIKKEKDHFAAEFRSAQEKIRREKEARDSTKKSKKSKRESKETWNSVVSSSKSEVGTKKDKHKPHQPSTDSEDDIPLSAISKKRKRHAIVHSDDVEDSMLKDGEYTPARKLFKLNDSSRIPVTEKDKKGVDGHAAPASPTSLFSEPSSPEEPLISAQPRPLPISSAPALPVKKFSSSGTSITIPRRPSHTLTKMTSSALDVASSGSGLSTKQRLAQGALEPKRPNAPYLSKPKANAPLPSKTVSATVMKSLSFKKKPALLSVNTTPTLSHDDIHHAPSPTLHQIQEPTLASLNASPYSPLLDDTPVAGPSQVNNAHEWAPSFNDPFADDSIDHSQTSVFPPTPTDPLMVMANNFLEGIMPPQIIAPLRPTADTRVEPVPPPSLYRKPALPARIPKKWRWSGTLSMGSGKGLSVTLQDTMESKQDSMRFSVALAANQTLLVPSLHDADDLKYILYACQLPSSLARLGPQGEEDAGPLRTIAQFMSKSHKVALSPIYLDEQLIGHILLFPPTMDHLVKHLKVPPDLRQSGGLVAALISWSLRPAQLSCRVDRPCSIFLARNAKMPPRAEKSTWNRSLRSMVSYHHALRVLSFPHLLHEFLTSGSSDRGYYAWLGRSDTRHSKKQGLETAFLHNIMAQTGAKYVGSNGTPRVVFVHVGALNTLYKLPKFPEWRARTAIHFYTYGTHERVPRTVWGIREIYPCGGVVTFTPSALSMDPPSVIRTIKQISKHPLWTCYVMPSVLGMLARSACLAEDPVAALNQAKFPYKYILDAIEVGELALLHAPPCSRNHPQSASQDWLWGHLTFSSLSGRKALEISLNTFTSKFSNVPESDLRSKMDEEIAQDLSIMQLQPAIMRDYRRFVILKYESQSVKISPQGLEWISLSNFDFKDDFLTTRP